MALAIIVIDQHVRLEFRAKDIIELLETECRPKGMTINCINPRPRKP